MNGKGVTIYNKKRTIAIYARAKRGLPGEQGDAGESAYQIWLDAGNTGSESDFLNSLKGANGVDGTDGNDGTDGESAYQIWLDQGNTGSESAFLESLKGERGPKGNPGAPGVDGTDGTDGDSAYQIWLDAGNIGSEAVFLASLKGEPGADGADGNDGADGVVQSVNGKSATSITLNAADVGADAAGSAATAQTNAQNYADAAVSTLDNSLGTAAFNDTGDFATAAQGAKADSAVQTETDPTVPSWAKTPSKPSYTKSDVGLSNVDNTSDANKPVSTAQQTALDGKLDKVTSTSVAPRAYVVTETGVQDQVPIYSGSASASSIARRTTSGAIFTNVATDNSHAANKGQMDAADALNVSKTGDTMTGALANTFAGTPYQHTRTGKTIETGIASSGRWIWYSTAEGVIAQMSGEGIYLGTDSDPRMLKGSGFPNGVVSAPVGSTYIDKNNTDGVANWSKKVGTGNTGWRSSETEWHKVYEYISQSVVSTSTIFSGAFPSEGATVRIVISGSVSTGGTLPTDLSIGLESSAPTSYVCDRKRYYEDAGVMKYEVTASQAAFATVANQTAGTSFELDMQWRFAGNGAWNNYKATALNYVGANSTTTDYAGWQRSAARPATFSLVQSALGNINSGMRVAVFVKY